MDQSCENDEKVPILKTQHISNENGIHGDRADLQNRHINLEVVAEPQTCTFDRASTSSDYSPQKNVEIESDGNIGKTTSLQTLMHLLKGMIGSGILAMPVAFKNGGLWLSFVCLFVIGVVCTHCMHLLVICSTKLCERTNTPTLDYAEVVGKCVETGPARLQRFSKAARWIVNGFLIFTQFGFCCIYIVFVSQNIKQVVDNFQPHNLSAHWYTTFTMILCILYNMIRNLKTMVPFSMVANVFNFIGLGIVIVNLLTGLQDVNTRAAAAPVVDLPLAFGQMVYSFEGIGLILPLQNKMRHKEEFGGWTGVLTVGLVVTICLYEAVGFYGYLKFGDATLGSITLNLPADQWLYLSAKVMFSVSIFISYGLMFYVPINIVWGSVTQVIHSRKIVLYGEYLFRVAMVLVTYGVAILVPNLGLLIGFVGAFASSSLALMFPATIELLTFSVEEAGISKWVAIKNFLIIFFGVIGFVTGTYSSLKSIIETFS